METLIVVIVLLVLIGLFGGVGYFYVREAGWENARHLLTAPRQLRRSFGSSADPAGERGNEALDQPVDAELAAIEHGTSSRGAGRYELALSDAAVRELREELHGELRRAAGLTREFDARLTRIEATVIETGHIPDEFNRTLQDQDARQRRRIERLQQELGSVRQLSGPWGQRRSDAIADLYGHLARVEMALAAVVNPMLLPGEPVSLPDEFYPDTLVWNNWNDVGDRAYAFGEVFNQNRFVLPPDVASDIERFIATLRHGLTGAVYPNVRASNPTNAQLGQMRAGLESIVDALPAIRRSLEAAYRADGVPETIDPDADDDNRRSR